MQADEFLSGSELLTGASAPASAATAPTLAWAKPVAQMAGISLSSFFTSLENALCSKNHLQHWLWA
jgi:hypothetical protein